MFGGRFSLIRFGLKTLVDLDMEVRVTFIELVQSLVSAGGNILIEKEYRERTESSSILTRGISTTHSFKENLNSNILLLRDIPIITEYWENVSAKSWMAGNIVISTQLLETINAHVMLSENIYFVHEFRGSVDSIIYLCKYTPMAHEFRESVFAMTLATLLEKYTFFVSDTLMPGEELRIDSDVFTAMIDERNVIHQHTGDWIMLDRGVVNIHVSSGTGEILTGQLVYLERYL